MSDDELGRIRGDLAVIQRAMGLHLSFGRGMLAFGILLTVASVVAAVVSLLVEDDRLQAVPFSAIMLLGPVGLFLRSRRNPDPGPEFTTQVMLSISGYENTDDESLFRALLGRRPDALLITGSGYSPGAHCDNEGGV